MHTRINRLGLGLLIFALASTKPALARPAPPGGHLNIDEVLVSIGSQDTTLQIIGQDFDFGASLAATLAGVPATIVGSPTSTQIIATVPTSLFPAGDYRLTVFAGNGQGRNDEYDLTIGAVGPTGPSGPPGETGATGPAGPPGSTATHDVPTMNVKTGSGALASLTTGTDNTAMGYRALNVNTTGYKNTASGFYALRSNTNGYDNTSMGFRALTGLVARFNPGPTRAGVESCNKALERRQPDDHRCFVG